MPPGAIPKLIAGAVIGGAMGFLMGRARVCTSQQCNVRGRRIFGALAGAVFGAALAWYFVKQ